MKKSISIFEWLIVILFMVVVIPFVAQGLELTRDKNVATKIVFPLIDSNGTVTSGASSLDSEYTYWNDSSIPGNYSDLSGEAVEVGSSGQYYLNLTAGEVNYDYIGIQVKSSECLTQSILINTRLKEAVDTVDDYVDTEVAAIKAKTDNLPADPADDSDIDSQLATIAGYIDTEVADILTDTGTTLNNYVDDLETRLTAARAGYLDKLNVSGTLAHSDAAATYKATGFSTHSAADVMNVDVSAYSGAGYAGTYLKNLYDNQSNWLTATGFSTHSAADVWAVATRALTELDEDSTTIDLDGSNVGGITGTVNDFDGLITHGDTYWKKGTTIY